MTGSTAVKITTDTEDWHYWCRLCAKAQDDNVNVYFKDGQTWTSVLAVAIGKYFWVNIKMEDELSNALCKDCYTLVEDLIEFSERVNRVQTLFTRLQNAASQAVLNYEEMRKDCGLQAFEWKHIIAKNEPEESTVADGAEYIVDDMVEEDEESAIMAEIEAEEIGENDEENAYETFVEHEESMEASTSVKDGDLSMNTPTQEDPSTTVELPSEEATKEVDDHLSETSFNERIEFKCMSCSKGYKKPMAYKRHMLVIHGAVATDLPDLECKRCSVTFATENQLTAHYRTHMPAKDRADNACSYCSKLFTTPAALKRHIMFIHENVKPFICDCCGKGMKTISALNEHKLVHTDECPYECSVCHRRFKNMARLKIHSDTHTNNNYKCNTCGLKLNTRRTLNMHQLVHSDAKQYKCDVCDAAFKRGKTLKAHLILHTGIRPYKCNFCGKDFSNGSNCRMHKRKTHPKELAEEEARGVMRSTLLPMITELTEASKRVKKPAKAGTALARAKISRENSASSSTTHIAEEDVLELEEEADDEMLYEIVEECP